MKLILFDVDGTLTQSRKVIEQPMLECLKRLKAIPNIHIGFVGGSDLGKQIELETDWARKSKLIMGNLNSLKLERTRN